jgi:hypothetical protein
MSLTASEADQEFEWKPIARDNLWDNNSKFLLGACNLSLDGFGKRQTTGRKRLGHSRGSAAVVRL